MTGFRFLGLGTALPQHFIDYNFRMYLYELYP